jgi:2-polyprenyl-3-methyl-5-hydroxy-6-metoxy-1,4-benzoquinol methylase
MTDRRTWSVRWRAALQEQHRLLFDTASGTIRPEFAEYTDCPACGSSRAHLRFEKDGFRYHDCEECGLVYMNPRLNPVATQQFYNSNVNEIYNETKFHDAQLTKGDDERNLFNLGLLEKHGVRSGRLLEVGCAKGFFLASAMAHGFEVHGLELNQQLCDLARAAVGETVRDVDLFDAAYPAGTFDVLYMRDLIEHIPNPRPFFDELNRVARGGATIVLETHNVDGLIHRAVGRRHTVMFGFEHPVHWSPRSITAALKRSGFDVVDIVFVSPDFSLQNLAAYAGEATFTTVFPPAAGALRLQLARYVAYGLSLAPIAWLDRAVMTRIANWTGHGSVMKVVARKTSDVAPQP